MWYAARQRAGPLTIECRALRPRLSHDDTAWERREKNKIIKDYRSAICRSPKDRLMLHIAVMGWDAWHHVLTFDREHEPKTYDEVIACWKSFYRKAKYWRGGQPFDWVRRVEGLHGDSRYHLHVIMRYSEFSPAEVEKLWQPFGMVTESTPVLKVRTVKDRKTGQHVRVLDRTFHDMAEYLTKERTFIIPDGKRAQSWSQSLHRQLPKPEKWEAEDSSIVVPEGLIWKSGPNCTENDFGAFYYMDYISEKPELNIE